MRRMENRTMLLPRVVFLFRRCFPRGLAFSTIIILFVITLCVPARAAARPLAGLSVPIEKPYGAADGAAAWADFDNDDDLDLLVTGIGNGALRTTILYENRGGSLEVYTSGLPRAENSSADWGDYDNDGWLDVLITGQIGYGDGQIIGLAGVYRNVLNTSNGARTFVLAYQLPRIYSGWGSWGDFNNDGRLDILLTGYTEGGAPLTSVYRNETPIAASTAVFTDITFNHTDLGSSQARWGDYNNDGYLDFVNMGRDAAGTLRALVYRNNRAGGFYWPISLTGMWGGSATWIDIENDGDLDLLLTGNLGDNGANIIPTTLLYRYQTGFSLATGTGLPDLWDSSVSVGDYDNDGDSDLLLSGLTRSDRPTAIYRNNRDFTFTDAGAGLPKGAGLSVAWGDFNKDKTLDVALSGVTAGDVYYTQVYLNNNPPPPANNPPAVPHLRAACWDNATTMNLVWSAPSDDHIDPAQPSRTGLTYNLRVGTTDLGQELFATQSNGSGWRRVAQPGNVGQGTSAVLLNVPEGSYHWSVQALDPALAGGGFSATGGFDPGTPVANDNTYEINEDTLLIFDVLTDDNELYAPLDVYSRTSPSFGKLIYIGLGIFTYLPNPGWHGTDRFTYYAIGSTKYCSPATVTINVADVPHAPEDIQLSKDSILEGSDAGTIIGSFTTADRDPEDTHTYSLVPKNGDNLDNALFQIAGSELKTNAVFSYSTRSSYTINVETRDPDGQTFTKTFTIRILQDTPVSITCAGCASFILEPTKTAFVTMSEDGSPTPFNLPLIATDAGASETLTWSTVSEPANGTLSYTLTTLPDQQLPIQYTPAADWFGTDSFRLHVTDPLGNTDEVTVTVDVQPVNDPPTLDAISDVTFLEMTGAHQIDLTGISAGPANEAGQPLTVAVETDNPALLRDLAVDYSGGATGVLRFYLNDGAGTATVTVTVRDGQAENGITIQTFQVTVVQGPRYYLPIIGAGWVGN